MYVCVYIYIYIYVHIYIYIYIYIYICTQPGGWLEFICGSGSNFINYTFKYIIEFNKTSIDFHPSGKIFLSDFKFSSELLVGEIVVKSSYGCL